jgi:cellulose synthase (UDP-forming)
MMTRSNLLFSLPWKGRGGEGVLAALSVVMFLALVAIMIRVPLDWQGQTVLAGCLFLFALVLSGRSKAQWVTLSLVGISVFLTSRYIWWRTIPNCSRTF